VSKSILFVCTVNRFRSVVAEYLLRRMLAEEDDRLAHEVEVSSAGIVTTESVLMSIQEGWKSHHHDGGLPEKVVTAMQRRGMDISGHQPRELDRGMVEAASLIIALEDHHKKGILLRFPSARGKVFVLRELVDKGSYPSAEGPAYRFSTEFIETVITQLEECLSEAMGRLLPYLREGEASA
jgi:protein-tyrosine-phosphatase